MKKINPLKGRRTKVIEFVLLFSSEGQIPHSIPFASHHTNAAGKNILQKKRTQKMQNVSLNDTFAIFIGQGYHIASVEYFIQRKNKKYPYRMIATLKLDTESITNERDFLIHIGQWIYKKCMIISSEDLMTIKCSGAHPRTIVNSYVQAGFIFSKNREETPQIERLEGEKCSLLTPL